MYPCLQTTNDTHACLIINTEMLFKEVYWGGGRTLELKQFLIFPKIYKISQIKLQKNSKISKVK